MNFKILYYIFLFIFTVKYIFCESYISKDAVNYFNKKFLDEKKKGKDDFAILRLKCGLTECYVNDDFDVLATYDNINNKIIISKANFDDDYRSKITEIDLKDKEYGYFTLFIENEYKSLSKFDILISDLSRSNLKYVFSFKKNVKKIEINELKCKNLSKMFRNLPTVIEIKIKKEIDVDNLEKAFSGCSNLKNINFENVKVNTDVDCTRCFKKCESLISIKTNKCFNSNKLYKMFKGCKNLENVDIKSNKKIIKVDKNKMFEGCDKFKNKKRKSFYTSSNKQHCYSYNKFNNKKRKSFYTSPNKQHCYSYNRNHTSSKCCCKCCRVKDT